MDIDVSPLTPEDFSDAYALWESSEGVVLQSDERHPHVFVRFLSRNPEMSFGARRAGRLIGAVLAGHDGRRGYVYHLAVAADCRRQGIGKTMVANVEREMTRQGIWKVHANVVYRNLLAHYFWKKLGWFERDDIALFSHLLVPG